MAATLKIRNGDIVMSASSGRPQTISGLDKANQDIGEFFTIDIQPSGFGAGIDQLVATIVSSGSSMAGLIDRQISSGISTMRSIQLSDVGTLRTSDEKILSVSHVQAIQDPSDPTTYYFRANVITESGKVIPVTIVNGD